MATGIRAFLGTDVVGAAILEVNILGLVDMISAGYMRCFAHGPGGNAGYVAALAGADHGLDMAVVAGIV